MAKKAKRRGRPPGSKNKVKGVRAPKGIAKSFAQMEVPQLRSLIDDLEGLLSRKIQQQRSILEGHLAELPGYVSRKAAGFVRTGMRVPKADGRAKPSLTSPVSLVGRGRLLSLVGRPLFFFVG